MNLNTHISRRRLFHLFQNEQTIVNFHVSAIVMIKGEFILLSIYLRNPNRLISRDQPTEQAHNRAWNPFDRGIDVQIGRLRRKLKEKDAGTPEFIKTVRGGGHMLAADVTEEAIER